MTSALLILTMIMLYTMQSFLCKSYADRYPGEAGMSSPVFTVVSGAVTAFISLCFMGFDFNAGYITVLLGVLNALALFGYNYFLVAASASGPYTALMVFAIAGSTIVPTLSAWIGFGQNVSVLKWVGVALLILGVYLSGGKQKSGAEAGAIVNYKVFIPQCIGLALCNGAYAALTDAQQRITGVSEREEMVCITYAVALALSLCTILVRSRGSFKPFKQTKASLVYLLLSSLSVGLAIHLMVIIIPLLNDITALHVLNNSGILVLSAVLSFFFFGERPTRKNIVGFATVCAASVLSALF